MGNILRLWALLISRVAMLIFCFTHRAKKRNFSPFILRSYLLPLTFYLLFLSSCNPTRYVSKGECLLRSNEVKIDNETIKKEELKPYIRQKPNKKIIGMKFHLWLYNRSKLDKENKWNKWLRKNGEEPVIWQQTMTAKTAEQLDLYLEKKGYYYAKVSDTVILKKKKADVIYRIQTGWPYRINKVSYSIPDTAIARLVLSDTTNTLLKRGILFDVTILENERKRIELNLKNKGYYSFAKDYITYPSDTTNLNKMVNIEMVIKPHSERTEDNKVIEAPYPLYEIRSLTVNASLNMQDMMEKTDTLKAAVDTLTYGEVSFIIPQKFPVKASTIKSSLYIFPDSLYRIADINRTYQHLQGLRNFKQVTISFSEPPGQSEMLMRELDCRINLLPFTLQSYAVELEGTNSDGNVGGGVRFQYQNKSLFKHAEIFDLKLRGTLEAVSTESNWQFKTKMEYEAEATLNVPQFLLPFRSTRFIQRYNPKTLFSILYNYQRRPDYTRTVFSTSFGYNWRGSDVISHIVKPLDVNFVKLPYKSADFDSTLNLYPYLKNSYQSHMVVSSSYSFIRDMRLADKENAFFIRTNFETAGLLLDAFYKLSGKSKNEGQPYEMFGNAFSQFVKGDIDLRYYYSVNGNNTLVSRIFTGMGWPYGNSKVATVSDDGITQSVASMPFEKKYYVGGANSIRGWRLRSLGPGSYVDTTTYSGYPNNTGDIKLEVNIEYRFKLIGLVEGALFMDAGNIWDTHKDKDRPGANFSFDRFYREIALSGGIGFRFNFNYFILRADLGMKIHDPAGSGRWVFTTRPDGGKRFSANDFNMSIGIGYPF